MHFIDVESTRRAPARTWCNLGVDIATVERSTTNLVIVVEAFKHLQNL